MTTLLFIFLGSFAIGVPIAFVLGLTALYYLLFVGSVPIMILGQRLYAGVDNFVLLAIPFFVFAGELMNRTKITEDLVNFAKMLVGWIPGALAQVNIVTSVFFAGLTGAAVADTAAIGSILIPAMKDEGYTAEYAAAVTVTSSIIGPIIPPSINMVVYSTVTMESVGALFMAGFAPGIAIALGLMIVALFFALRDNHPRRKERLAKGEALRTTRKSLLALLAPVILVGGIFSGQFTPTEAAAVACAYVLFVGVFIFRTLGWNEIFESLKVTAVTSSVILFIISIATVFATMLTLERIPAHIAHYILSLTGNKYIFLLLVNIFLLFVGMIMETGVSVILLAPILLPVATRLGIHPLHFALVMLVNLNIGLNTPPLGVCLYVAAPIAKIRFEKIARAAVPFIAIQIVVLMIITYIPEIILFLPRLFGYIT